MIPVNEPILNGNELNYLKECIETGWISSEGPFVEKLESQFANYIGRKYGVAVCNGTAALQVAIDCLELDPGSEVILPSFTIISCALAVVRAGLTPVFVDSDMRTYNTDVEKIESLITPKTKAIMAVHIYGLPVDMDPIMALSEKYGLFIIEDAAQAIGQAYNGKKCGSFGNLSTFSFYPNKHITTGEGGMVLTDSKKLAGQIRSLRNLCFDPGRRFYHKKLGYNFRMTNLQAAVGVAQLEKIDDFIAKKREIGKQYNELLKDIIDFVALPLDALEYAKNIYWVYGIVLRHEFDINADQVTIELNKRGIGTRPFFYPLDYQPALAKYLRNDKKCKNAMRLYKRGFYLPSGLALEDKQIEMVSKVLTDILRNQNITKLY